MKTPAVRLKMMEQDSPREQKVRIRYDVLGIWLRLADDVLGASLYGPAGAWNMGTRTLDEPCYEK
ncbi:MAG: hypothetical protein NVS4B11_32280 [Ktedonobacteraceae bacterium]